MKNKQNNKTRLIVLPNDNLGGAEQILKMVALYFQEEEVEVRFLTSSKSGAWNGVAKNANLVFGSFNSEYLGAMQLILGFLFKFKRKQYSCIFTSHVFVTGIIGILIRCQVIKAKFFIGRESTSIFKRFKGFKLMLYKVMYSRGYSSVDLLICQTERMKHDLLKVMPELENRTKIKVIPNPIDLTQIFSDASIPQIIDYGSFIVSAGRLIPEKGFDILIRVFKSLKVENPNLKLVILGEGIERANLRRLIIDNDLENEVILTGFVANVFPYFRAATLCVVSSRIEGFPNVLLQMMSQNTKIVSTKCAGGIEDIPGIFTAEVEEEPSLLNSIQAGLLQDTRGNRFMFDQFLKERSIECFIKQIELELHPL